MRRTHMFDTWSPRFRRGTALIQVLTITFIALAVSALVLVSTGALRQQSNESLKNAQARFESRSGVQTAAAWLNKWMVQDSDPIWHGSATKGAEFVTVGTQNFMVLVGSGATCSKSTATFVSGTDIADFGDGVGGLGSARDLLKADNSRFVVRVESKGTTVDNFYWEVICLAKPSDFNANDPDKTVLTARAVLLPRQVEPWQYGLAGLQGVNITGGGGTVGPNSGTSGLTLVATNGDITWSP